MARKIASTRLYRNAAGKVTTDAASKDAQFLLAAKGAPIPDGFDEPQPEPEPVKEAPKPANKQAKAPVNKSKD